MLKDQNDWLVSSAQLVVCGRPEGVPILSKRRRVSVDAQEELSGSVAVSIADSGTVELPPHAEWLVLRLGVAFPPSNF